MAMSLSEMMNGLNEKNFRTCTCSTTSLSFISFVTSWPIISSLLRLYARPCPRLHYPVHSGIHCTTHSACCTISLHISPRASFLQSSSSSHSSLWGVRACCLFETSPLSQQQRPYDHDSTSPPNPPRASPPPCSSYALPCKTSLSQLTHFSMLLLGATTLTPLKSSPRNVCTALATAVQNRLRRCLTFHRRILHLRSPGASEEDALTTTRPA